MNQIEYNQLNELLKEYSKAYYEGNPLVTDYEYDSLIKEIKEYEKNHLANTDSITKVVGTTSLNNKIDHIEKMYSMEDLFSLEEVKTWLSRKNVESLYYVMPKYDGCSLNLTYIDGKLFTAVTRGDGYRGEDVTYNAKYIRDVPTYISHKGKIEIRGEVVIPKTKFEELNLKRIENNLPTFSNPRNLASGSIRVKNENIEDRWLTFVPWGIGYNELNIDTYDEQLTWLKENGFTYDSYGKVVNENDVLERCSLLEEHRDGLKYQLDGAVIKVNNIKDYKGLGYTEKYPKGIVAFKFKAVEVVTELLDVKWQVGKSGVITPVGVLKPIEISGSIVSNVTLHNMNYIRAMELKIGDIISMIKSGDVIPKLSNVYKGRRTGKEHPIVEITKCPSCNSELFIDGAYRVCANEDCPSKNIGKLIHFGSKKALNINGLGDKVVEQLYNNGLIKEYKDLYKLTVEDLQTLDGFSTLKANNLITAIEASKGIELHKFIYSLNIDGVGETGSKVLASYGNNWFNTPSNLLANSKLDIRAIEGFTRYVNKNKEMIIELMNIIQPSIKKIEVGNIVCCITGTLSISRDAMVEKLNKLGIEVKNSVTKETKFLIVGDDPGASKLNKAKQLGIKIVSESEAMDNI